MHPSHHSDRPRDLWPPRDVKQVTSLFLDLVDEAAPGLVEGLYLHGSIGFGEWYAGRSDVDFVAVTADRPTTEEVGVLRDVHARVGETFLRPPLDGFHVTWADLARPSYDCPDVPCILGGDWRDQGRFDVNPVTWHELAWHGVHVRGPRLEDVDVWTDTQALQEHSHRNLQEYWAGQLELLARFPDEGAKPDLVAWFVLGVPRLHHVLETGRLTSKDGAGRHAVATFGERWRPVVAEALTYRALGESSGAYDGRPDRLAADVQELTALALEAGLALDPKA
jgi:hypothetical protein